MPLAPANPAVDEEDQPPVPKPLIGTTGGEIPEQESDVAKRQPVAWSPDPMERRTQVRAEIDRRRTVQFQKERPFTPSSWQPNINTPQTRAEDRDFAGAAEDQFQFQQHTAREAEINRRRTAIEAQKNENDTLEAQMRGSGQQFYTDSHGRIKPVIEAGTNRPLYNKTGWAASKHPETGKPVLEMRDQYGQRQYREAPVVASLDPSDDQMYYKMPDGTTEPAGTIDEFAKHPNYQVAKAALAAKTRQVKAVHQQALQPMRLLVDQAVAQLEDTTQEVKGIEAEIATTTEAMANAVAPDGSPTPRSEGLAAALQQMQLRHDELSAQIKPNGKIAQHATRAKKEFTIASATAMREAYASQQEEIAASVRARGGKPEDDPTFRANQKGMRDADEVIRQGTEQIVPGENPTSTPVGQPTTQTGVAPAAGAQPSDVLQQSEPFAVAQRGVTHIGNVAIKEFARRYGDGTGPVQPDSLLRLYRRSKDLETTLANEDTSLNQTIKNNLQKERDYVDALAKQRFARLPEDQQKRVTEATRDPTWWDFTKGKIKSGAEAAAVGGGAVLKGLAEVGANAGPRPQGPGFTWTPTSKETEDLYRRLENRTPQEKMEATKNDPIYKMGTFIQDAAREAYAKNPHEQEGVVSQALNAAAEAAGGFAPLVASGPAAPLTVGLQTAGDEMQRIYDEQVKKGVAPERAAAFAQKRALASGALQAVLFEILPKPLQKAGNKFIIDKIAGGALTKFLANRLAQGAEGAVMGATSSAAGNVAAGRDATTGTAESAEGLALMQAVMPRGGAPKKPKGGEPAPKPEPTAPLTPEQKAAEAEFQKRLAEPVEPPKPSTAAEAAAVFEPALKEKANVPPPAKSAKESAAAIADVQDASEATSKVLSQQEGKAQKLVDEIQEATGKPREEILATRKGRDVAEWSKELETEAKYQKSPLTVDPERRTAELKSDLKKLDSEWEAHREMVSSNAERLANTPSEGEIYKSTFEADRTRHESLTERRSAIESELAKAEATRQSPQGAAALKEDLAAEQKQAEAGARKLPTPELEGRRDSIEQQLTEADRVRQSAKGGEDLKKDLAQSEDVVDRVLKQTPEEFKKWSRSVDGGQTNESYRVGIAAIGDNAKIAKLKSAKAENQKAYRKAAAEAKSATPETEEAAHEAASMLGYKDQFFEEAIQAAENTGSAIGAPEIVAAHAAHEAKKKAAPVDIGKRDEKISTGTGVATPHEQKMMADWKAQITEEQSAKTKPKKEPVHKIVPPKDAAPVSADIKAHTPETVEGPKINKEWTAFGKESGTLGVPRTEMPQVKSEHRGALVNFLKARGLEVKAAMVNPEQLKPTQAEFSPAKVQKAREFSGSERPILISADGHLVDGHHQWMAGLQDDPKTPMPVLKINAPIDKVLAEMKEFPSTENAKGAAAKAATKEPSVSAPAATKRLSDRAIEALESAKYDIKGLRKSVVAENEGVGSKLVQVPEAYKIAHNAAIDLAILGIRAGRALNDVVKLALDRFKAKYPSHTPEDLAKVESGIRAAIENRPAERAPGTEKSEVPKSLREVGVPAKDITYDVRAQNERMAEARAEITKDPVKAEAMIGDRNLPADTRVAIGGVLLEKKMEALKTAKPEEVAALTRDIQRITEATRAGVSTESGQGVAMHSKIYENLAVGSAMEYAKAATRERTEKIGGEESVKAAQEAADVFNKTKDQAARDAAIEKLKEKYSTKPARKMLDQLKRIEVTKELNKLGVLTRDDMIDVAGNALGIPGIEAKKLKHIADLADRVEKAPNHAARSRAELELADTLNIYKGVNPLDLEASILTLNILSGPSTQAANLEGNALNLFAQLGTTAAVNPTKLGPIMKGLKEGIPLGWDQAKSILVTGRGTKDFQDRTLGSSNALANIDYARDFSKLNSKVGDALTVRARVVEKIARFMKAADAVFYYPAREAYARLVATKLLEGQYKGEELAKKVSETLHTTPEAFEAARQQATREGYNGVALGRRVSDIIEEKRSTVPAGEKTSVGSETVKQSERFAAEATFNNEPVGLAGVIYRNLARTVKDADVAGVPVLKPWAMFLRVPANVFNATTNFTPMGASRAFFGMKGEAYRKGGSGEGQWRHFTRDERNRLYLQSVIGTTLMAGLTARILSSDDVNVTAAGPGDPSKRAQLKAAGWNPYSIKVGNRWISYKDSPLLVPLAIVGHVADAVRYQKAKSDLVLGSRVADAVSHAPQIIFQTSMLSGLSDLMSSLSGQGDVAGSVTRTLGSVPANLLIPYNRLLQQIDQTFDEKVHKSNPITDSIPFVRRTGDVQTDVQGRARTFSPFARFATQEKNDSVDNILRQKNVFIPEAGKDSKVGNRVMSDDEYNAYRRLSGQRIRTRLQAVSPQMRMMTQEQAQKLVEKISREEREKVRPLIGAGVRN